jgi:hypothetical protein
MSHNNNNNNNNNSIELDNETPLIEICSSCGRPINWTFSGHSDRNLCRIRDPHSGNGSASRPLVTYMCVRCADRIVEDMRSRGYPVDEKVSYRQVVPAPP